MKRIFVAKIKNAGYICDDGYVILADSFAEAKTIATNKFTKNHDWLNSGTEESKKEFKDMLDSMTISELDMESESKVFFTSNVGG